MDPVTQGVVGASASQLVATNHNKFAAAVIGCLAGMAADLDVLIKSSSDPLLGLEYHRHFTHALVFIPIGALICAMVFYKLMPKNRVQFGFKGIYLFSFVGYATHALLDACTTYGTQLFWPFSDARIAWNNVSVIDPMFTIPLLILVCLAVRKQSRLISWLAASYAVAYLLMGVVQNNRAEKVALELALERGHSPINLGLKPSFANIIVWKSVYEYNDKYYVDAVRVFGRPSIIEGVSVEKLDLDKHFSWLDRSSQQAKDIERFRWFSNDHLGVDANNENKIVDIRYSMLPNQAEGLWGIVLSENAAPNDHVIWDTQSRDFASAEDRTSILWNMVKGETN